MTRLALISDIHGNLPALDAVLKDIACDGVEDIYCLGDLVGYGPDPAGVIDRVASLGIPTVRGNYDDGIGNRRGECGCYYATDQAGSDGAASYAFTDAALDDGHAGWLAALPDSLRRDISGVRFLFAHGSPRKINGYLTPDRSDEQLVRLAETANADVVCVGHTHVPYHRTMTGTHGRPIHYVNAGSLGKPKDGDPRACWTEIVVGSIDEIASVLGVPACGPAAAPGIWLATRFHRVPYDIAAVQAAMRSAGLPETLIDALAGA
jgi:putative phosphoesterase